MKTKARVGQRVRAEGGYTATVLNVGTIPETHECRAHRGLPGALLAWDRLDETTLQQTPAPAGDVSDCGWAPLTWIELLV